MMSIPWHVARAWWNKRKMLYMLDDQALLEAIAKQIKQEEENEK